MSIGNIPPYKQRLDLPTEYVALGIVCHGGRILITRRRKTVFLGGLWEFPGGKRKSLESYAQCVVREIREEVGIEVEAVRELMPVRHDYPKRRVVLQPYLCRLIEGEPVAVECDDVRWVTPGELAEIKMPEANAPIIQQLLHDDCLQDRTD